MRPGKASLCIPALDGLRAVSILLVFFSHQGYEDLIPGGLGVTAFFFISGFLITNLLCAEYQKTNRLDFKGFFIRRLLRLYPALLFVLVLFSAFLLATGQRIAAAEVVAALFYFENYYAVYFKPIAAHFSILWSLAVEEHFYLLFPLLFIGLVRKPVLLLLTTLGFILLPLLLRIYTTSRYGIITFSEDSTYYLTHCRFDSILFGCLLSVVLQSGFRQRFLRAVSTYSGYAVGLGLLAITLFYRDECFRQTYRYSLQGVAFLFLIPPIVYSQRYRLLNASFRQTTSSGPLLGSCQLLQHLVSLRNPSTNQSLRNAPSRGVS